MAFGFFYSGLWGLGFRKEGSSEEYSPFLPLVSREGLEKFGDYRGTATRILSFIPPKPEARVDIQRVVLATAKTKSIIVGITITAPRHRESHTKRILHCYTHEASVQGPLGTATTRFKGGAQEPSSVCFLRQQKS